MAHWLACALFAAALAGLVACAAQVACLVRHLRRAPLVPRGAPAISILKPLCGVDDGLARNLESFAALDWPDHEVLLGLASLDDAAWPVARAAARRWPGRFRVVLQRGAPGLNPKVNQLITLAREARHDLLVVSDSNVRVGPGYLAEIAALLEDEQVGLVTHLISGAGRGTGHPRLGALLDQLHLAGFVSAGMVGAQRLAGRDVVVGKSMALRRRDLEALGGFAVVKDVLAEDFVLGRMTSEVLGKKVALASQPVWNVTQRTSVLAFAGRHHRWSVMQRQAVGPAAYGAIVLLNPTLLAAVGAAMEPSLPALAVLATTCAAKAAFDGVAGRALGPGGFTLGQLAAVPFRDLVAGAAWASALFHDRDPVARPPPARAARHPPRAPRCRAGGREPPCAASTPPSPEFEPEPRSAPAPPRRRLLERGGACPHVRERRARRDQAPEPIATA